MNGEGPRTLVVAEPFCLGFEHAAFNAAFLHACLRAYPGDACHFLGEASHLACVAEIIQAETPKIYERITWKEITLAGRDWNGWRQFAHTRALIRGISRAVDAQTRALVFTAARELDILALKELLLTTGISIPVLAILHGVLRTSLLPAKPRAFSSVRGLRLDFRLPHPQRLRFLALGEPILAALRELVPHAARHFRSIDLPYLWKVFASSAAPFSGDRPLFGYLGVSTTSGFDSFLEIVRAVRRERIGADFRMVGHVSQPAQRAALTELGIDASSVPLSYEEYARRARSIDFALWTIEPGEYRLTASTSFLESLSFVKPGIHLRNPYFDYYFARMGNIGYLCDSPGAIVRQIGALCSHIPPPDYAGQCQAILTGRDIFHPAAVGLRLREIISEMELEE